MSSSATVASLEQRYIELLERNIARLENAEDDAKSKPSSLVSHSDLNVLAVLLRDLILSADQGKLKQLDDRSQWRCTWICE